MHKIYRLSKKGRREERLERIRRARRTFQSWVVRFALPISAMGHAVALVALFKFG